MQQIPLSARLRCCAGFVPPGSRVADIGTDHGYLGLWLLEQGIATSVIASDIAPGPLSAAKANAEKYGYADRMELCLSDGARDIPRDFDTLVCAGMGGVTMVHILSDAPWLRSSRYRLVLQCQSKAPLLRRFLSLQGWCVEEEACLREGRHLYTVMRVSFCPDRAETCPGQWYFPQALLRDCTPAAGEYYRFVLRGLETAAAHSPDGEVLEALRQVRALGSQYSFLKEE